MVTSTEKTATQRIAEGVQSRLGGLYGKKQAQKKKGERLHERDTTKGRRLAEQFTKVSQTSSRLTGVKAVKAQQVFTDVLFEQHNSGAINFFKNDENTVDLDQFFALVKRNNPVLKEAFDEVKRLGNDVYNPRHQRIVEHYYDALDNSGFAAFLETVPQLGTWEMCRSDEQYGSILSLVQMFRVGCGQVKLASSPVLPNIDLECMASDEETPWFGIGHPLHIQLGDRCKKKFAMGYKQELCTQFRASVEAVMRSGMSVINEMMARSIVKILFNIYDESSNAHRNPWKFNLQGTEFNTYYQYRDVDNTFGAPWMNMLYSTADLSGCGNGPFEIFDRMEEDLRDLRTGRLLTCCDNKQLIALHKTTADLVGRLLGGFRLEHDADPTDPMMAGCGNGRVFADVGARQGYTNNVFYNKTLADIAYNLYADLPSTAGLTGAQVKQKMARTLYAGCPSEQFGIQVEWEPSTTIRSGTATKEWFDQEILFGIKFMVKNGMATTLPQAGMLINGLHDSEAVPALATIPA